MAEPLTPEEEVIRLIETGENRAMATDGPVPHFRGELDDAEWRRLWVALGKVRATLDAARAAAPVGLAGISADEWQRADRAIEAMSAPDPVGLREAFIWYDERTAQNVVAAKDYEALRLATPAPLDEAEPSYIEVRTTACHAGSDGDCSWSECPQLRDGEPTATGRHCPLDRMPTSPAETARRFPLATAYAAAPGPVGLPEREYGTLRDRCVHSPCCMTLRQHDERIVPSPDPVGLRCGNCQHTKDGHPTRGAEVCGVPWCQCPGFLTVATPAPLDECAGCRVFHELGHPDRVPAALHPEAGT